MTGDIDTNAGTPASAQGPDRRQPARRAWPHAAPGWRASRRSSVVTDSITTASPSRAIADSRSRSSQHAVRLGRDRHRMPRVGQHLQHAPRDPPRRLDRLVRVGVGAHRQRRAHVTRPRQFGGEAGARRRAWRTAALSKSSPGDRLWNAWLGRAKQ